MKRCEGLSLIELLVVLFLISIISVISISGVEGVLIRNRVESCVRNICGAMRFAGYHARAEGVRVRMKLQNTNLILEYKKGHKWKILKSIQLASRVVIISKGKPIFYPPGSVVPAGSFSVSTEGDFLKYKITVSSVGRIKIKKSVS